MTTRHVVRTVAATVLTFGMVALGAKTGRAQNTAAIPEEGGQITMVGCFTTGTIKDHERFVLAKPIVGSVASVPEPTCTASSSDQIIKLQDLKQVKMGDAQLGRWVEIHGRLEGNHRADAIREVHVKSFSLVPVVVPPPPVAAVVIPEPAPQAAAPAPIVEPAPAPVPTTGVTEERKKLPKTASSLPLIGLIGLMSLGAALALRLASGRRTDLA